MVEKKDPIIDVQPPPRRTMKPVIVKVTISPIVGEELPPALVTNPHEGIRYESYSPAVRARFRSDEMTLFFKAEISPDSIVEIGERCPPPKDAW